eukprot:2711438-Rhodomonas_salina.2
MLDVSTVARHARYRTAGRRRGQRVGGAKAESTTDLQQRRLMHRSASASAGHREPGRGGISSQGRTDSTRHARRSGKCDLQVGLLPCDVSVRENPVDKLAQQPLVLVLVLELLQHEVVISPRPFVAQLN